MSDLKNNTVVVGMSGGVDSSVTALLLKEKGYNVIGITMNVWQREETENVCEKACCALDSVNDARKVCNKLDVPFYVLNFKDIFKSIVIDNFVSEYISGKTPNPCIMCNRYVKFETLLNKALALGASYIATGHYARVDYNKETDRYFLRKSVTDKKDQTYALYNLKQEQLKHIIMPLGEYTKEEVRKIANDNSLVNANKHDSQEICFVEDNNYAKFIEEKYNYKSKPGNFIDKDGNILGKHKGIIHYTIGQRRGLGISFNKSVYVVSLNVDDNTVTLGEEEELLKDNLICTNVNFMPFEKLEKPIKVSSKIRYNTTAVMSTIYPLENGDVKVIFENKVKSITPGQAVVFYDNDILVGGGTII